MRFALTIPKPFGLTDGSRNSGTHGKFRDRGKERDHGVNLFYDLARSSRVWATRCCRTVNTDGQSGSELESYIMKITAIASKANTAMAAPKISHNHQSARRRANSWRTERRCDEACFSRGVLGLAFSSIRLLSVEVDIAVEKKSSGLNYLGVGSSRQVNMLNIKPRIESTTVLI